MEYSLEISYQCDLIYTLQKEAVAAGEDPYQYSWPSNSGSALQFGGIKAQYDMTKSKGHRVITAAINGKAIDPSKVYTVATNQYVAGNKDYEGMTDAELVKEYGTCEQALAKYIQKNTFATAAGQANLTQYTASPEGSGTPEIPTQPSGSGNDNKDTPTGDNASPIWPIMIIAAGAAFIICRRKKLAL